MGEVKDVLSQYCEMRGEIKYLRERIDKDEKKLRQLEEEGEVTDSVKGSRGDGTIGSIRITGFPIPEYDTVKAMMKKRLAKLRIMEGELLEALDAVDDFISKIPQSDLRMMFQMYYQDDMTWAQVALNMNYRYPKRRLKYTEDSCRMRHNRYIEENLK